MAAPASSWSLARRLTGGAVLVALLAFVAQVLVLDFWIRPLLDELAAATAAHSSSIRTALAAVPAAQRPALAQSLSGESVRVASAAPASAAQATDDVLGTEFVRRLRAHLGRSVLVRAGDGPAPGADVEVGVSVDGQTWWIDFSQPAQEAAVLDTLVIWLAVLAIVALAAVLLSVRFVTRPLGRLAQQIGSRGSQVVPIEPDPHSSAELQRIVAAFNDLARTVEQAHSMRQQLLAGVSHDLRTPLTRLRLALAMLPADQRASQDVADMEGDLDEMERLVDSYLAFARGEGAEQARPVDLAAMLGDITSSARRSGSTVALTAEAGLTVNL
ncbi:MAG: hypothetical protein KGL43_12815, partial [Burkholderiales bacterium]|nr:hypothetical protein [Burkholderiales bacterium]